MVTVAVGIILDNARVLLCQREQSSRYPLKWEFPGGKVEPGERIEDALRRELYEELMIRVTVGELYHRQQHVYPDSGTFDIFYHRIRSFTGEIVNQVFASFAWVPVRDLPIYDILEGNRIVVDKLIADHA
jgi:8-oxo-dGTP diphosphatase